MLSFLSPTCEYENEEKFLLWRQRSGIMGREFFNGMEFSRYIVIKKWFFIEDIQATRVIIICNFCWWMNRVGSTRSFGRVLKHAEFLFVSFTRSLVDSTTILLNFAFLHIFQTIPLQISRELHPKSKNPLSIHLEIISFSFPTLIIFNKDFSLRALIQLSITIPLCH